MEADTISCAARQHSLHETQSTRGSAHSIAACILRHLPFQYTVSLCRWLSHCMVETGHRLIEMLESSVQEKLGEQVIVDKNRSFLSVFLLNSNFFCF